MRDFTKNLASFSWAMTLFSARQLGAALNPREWTRQGGEAAGAFHDVTDTVVRQFGQNLRQTYDIGDKLQGEIINTMFKFLSPGGVNLPGVGVPPAAGGSQAGGSSSAGASPWPTAAPGAAAPSPPPAAAPSPASTPPPAASSPVSHQQPAIFNATSKAKETVLITYTHGQGTFSDDRKYIALKNPIFNLDGIENGLHEGVWEALFDNPAALLARPAPPVGPMDQPVGPVESFPISANTIAKWTHADGSSISSVGPAASHLIPLSDGSFLFLVITAQIITEGTGRFAGAYGLTQSLGATWVPAGTNLFSPDGPKSFPATTLDTFKYITLSTPPDLSKIAGSLSGASGGSPSGASGASSSGSSGSSASAAGSPIAASTWPTPQPCAPGTPSCEVTPDSSDSKYVDVLGSRMHYIDKGSGDVVLFLHGNPVWSYIWRDVLPFVSPGLRCIAPDLIGMGLSDKPGIKYTYFDHIKYVEGFIDALGLTDYTMVLHDWGSIIGFYVAMKRDAQVRGLAFMEAMLAPYPSWNSFPSDIAETFKAFRDPKTGPQLIVTENVFVEKLAPASTVVKLTDDQMNCIREPFIDPASREVILQFTRQLPVAGVPADVAKATGQYARWLRKTNKPKLFLWAKPGLITTEKDVEFARKNFKNLKTSFLGEGLHFVQFSHPKEIGEEVSRWHSETVAPSN